MILLVAVALIIIMASLAGSFAVTLRSRMQNKTVMKDQDLVRSISEATIVQAESFLDDIVFDDVSDWVSFADTHKAYIISQIQSALPSAIADCIVAHAVSYNPLVVTTDGSGAEQGFQCLVIHITISGESSQQQYNFGFYIDDAASYSNEGSFMKGDHILTWIS